MTQSLDAAIGAFAPVFPLGIAFSGGADSTALLLACAARWPQQVVALHINHGLQVAAADFERHCRAVCATLDVPLRVLSVAAQPASGQSPEDAARIARYRGLLDLARQPDQTPLASIALAQHADDQIETLLLALSRGAGMAGLSAMPAIWEREGLTFYRPLLDVAGSAIRPWLQARGATWVEDPTNQSDQYTRNRIRARLLPALEAEFPQFRDTFARSARHAAQAQELLDELALSDWAAMAPTGAVTLPLRGLQQLSDARRANVLRRWLKDVYGVIPSAAQLAELVAQVAAATTRGHQIRIKTGLGFAVRQGPSLAWYNPAVLHEKN